MNRFYSGINRATISADTIIETLYYNNILLSDVSACEDDSCQDKWLQTELFQLDFEDELKMVVMTREYDNLLLNIVKKNIFRTNFKKELQLTTSCEFFSWKMEHIKYINPVHFQHKIRLTINQFKQQVDWIYNSMFQYYIQKKLDIDNPIKLEFIPLKIDISVKLCKKLIWKTLLVLVRLMTSGACIKSMEIEWGITYKTIKKYLNIASIYSDYFYQNYWCHKYWTTVCLYKLCIYFK